MQREEIEAIFDQQAASYDRQWAKLAPIPDALHFLAGAVLLELPADARILCVGAGTGNELVYFAGRFPGWRFTAVDPSGPMLDVCRTRAEQHGFSARCTFHKGYLDSLPASESFHATTSFLVSQFILEYAARAEFFNTIARRLAPNGYLINADLCADTSSPAYRDLLEVWLRMMTSGGVSAEAVERMRVVYGRDVALLPSQTIAGIIAAGGFETPVEFFQGGLIHGWYARRRDDSA